MESSKLNSCKKKVCECKVKSKKHQNGKGDTQRPTKKNQFNKNYESINWKK